MNVPIIKKMKEKVKRLRGKMKDMTANEIAALALFVTVIIAGIYFFQLLSMQKSVRIEKNALIVSQRAYVYAKNANIITGDNNPMRPPNNPVQVNVNFDNSGQTWARNYGGTIDFYLSTDGGIPTDFTYPTSNLTQPVLLAPKVESQLFKELTPGQFSDIRTGKKALFVYGTTKYQDVFGEWHRTEYCFQYAGIDYKPDGTIEQYLFWKGPTHNCADDDCKD
jgi:hypothetical protein